MVIVDEKKLPLVPPLADSPSEEPPAYTPNEASSSRGRGRGASVRGITRGRGRGGPSRGGGGPSWASGSSSSSSHAGPPRASTSSIATTSIPGQVPPSFTNPTEQPIVRTNHLKLHRQNDPLKGRWLIDTSLQLPAGLLDPLPEGETVRPNLYLSSENSQVYADVEIEGPKTEKAVVIASSTNGPVSVQILRRTGPLSLAASSTNSSITIYLPQDFQGPLNWKTKHGTVKFSAMLQSRLTQFGQKRNNPDNIITNMLIAAFKSVFASPNDAEGMEYGFIGQWVGSGYDDVDDLSEWKGDYCEVRNVHGSLKFAYIDEPKEPNVFEGLLKGLFGGG